MICEDWKRYIEKLIVDIKENGKTKMNSFRKFCEEIDSTPTTTKFYKMMSRGKVDTVMAERKPERSSLRETRRDPCFYQRLKHAEADGCNGILISVYYVNSQG